MPRRSERAADQQAQPPNNGLAAPLSDTSIEPIEEETDVEERANDAAETTTALATLGPQVAPDPGLYAVLGLDPSVSDAEIQTTYRRQAARLQGGRGQDQARLRQLNFAYEVLGTRVRREEYDRSRLAQHLAPNNPTPIQGEPKAPVQITRRRRPRHAVEPHYAGFSYVLAVLLVVGLAVAAGALIILPRLSFNLTALNALQSVLPLPNPTRSAINAGVTPVATLAPTATAAPTVTQRFAGTSVSVSNPNPGQNTVETVVIKLRLDGQPAVNADVWAIVTYSTTEERWPATGTQKTDATGVATITFNIGRAIADHPVPVEVFGQVGDQHSSWSTTFTPH